MTTLQLRKQTTKLLLAQLQEALHKSPVDFKLIKQLQQQLTRMSISKL